MGECPIALKERNREGYAETDLSTARWPYASCVHAKVWLKKQLDCMVTSSEILKLTHLCLKTLTYRLQP